MTVLSFVVSPIAGELSHRIPIRVLLGARHGIRRGRLLLMHGVDADSIWTALLPGSCSPASASGSPTRASARRRSASCRWKIGDGVGHQHDLPPGRDRNRGRRPRRGLPIADRLEARRVAAGCPPRARRGGRLRRRQGAALVAPPGEHDAYVHAAKVAFVAGFNEIVLIAAIVSFAGAARRVPPGPLVGLRAADRGRGGAGRASGRTSGGAAGAEVLPSRRRARRRARGRSRSASGRRGSRRRRGRPGRRRTRCSRSPGPS